MAARLIKATALFAALIALSAHFCGCKPKGAGEDAGKGAKLLVTKIITREEEPPKLPPQASPFVERTFAGMELDVSASDAVDVNLGPPDDPSRYAGMVLKEAVFVAKAKDGHTTEIYGPQAIVDPAGKRVSFNLGAVVKGPWENMLDADRLTWHYSKDVLEADGRFTLSNGHGITSGSHCTTDISFTSIQID